MARVKRRQQSLKERKEWLEQKTANRRRNHEGVSSKRAATRERERLRQEQHQEQQKTERIKNNEKNI